MSTEQTTNTTTTEVEQATEQVTETNATTETQTEQKPLTAEDVQKMIQSETDKVRTDYAKKLKEKDKELEAIKVEKMSEEEKKAHEIEQTLKENEALRAQLLQASTIAKLSSVSLSHEFAEFISGSNEEEVATKVNNLKLLFDKAVSEKANELFKSKGTDHKQTLATGAMTKAEFKALSYDDKVKLLNENPELYHELAN